jgi:hypothetical protein
LRPIKAYLAADPLGGASAERREELRRLGRSAMDVDLCKLRQRNDGVDASAHPGEQKRRGGRQPGKLGNCRCIPA